MCKITYYYDPKVKCSEIEGRRRYSVDMYVTDNKRRRYAGTMNGDSPIEALKHVRNVVNRLNQPRPLFGYDGKIAQWIWWLKWMKDIRN